jgi:hypothetical protein
MLYSSGVSTGDAAIGCEEKPDIRTIECCNVSDAAPSFDKLSIQVGSNETRFAVHAVGPCDGVDGLSAFPSDKFSKYGVRLEAGTLH